MSTGGKPIVTKEITNDDYDKYIEGLDFEMPEICTSVIDLTHLSDTYEEASIIDLTYSGDENETIEDLTTYKSGDESETLEDFLESWIVSLEN